MKGIRGTANGRVKRELKENGPPVKSSGMFEKKKKRKKGNRGDGECGGRRVNEIMRLISPSFDSTFFPIFDLRNESNVD